MQQQTAFVCLSAMQDTATSSSFVAVHSIAKNNKSFSKDEFIKDWMLQFASIICPEVRDKIERTIVCQIDDIAWNLTDELTNASKSSLWFLCLWTKAQTSRHSVVINFYQRNRQAV